MLGLLIIVIISWILLKLFKIKMSALGLHPNKSRLIDFGVGFLASAIICIIYFSGIIWLLNYKIEINREYDIADFIYGFWWTLQSVLTEELIFRGAFLLIAIRYLGEVRACILSAFMFGVYHWFSYNVFGNLMPMLHTFIITSIGGFIFAYAYAKTRSLYLPLALHFGWNLITIIIFSEGPLGEQLIISSGGNSMGYFYFVFLLYQISILPLFTFWYLRNTRGKNSRLELNTSAL